MMRAALLAALIVLRGLPVAAADDDILFSADLSPDEESAVVDSPAKGHIDLWLERATLRVRWKVTYMHLSAPATAAGLFGPENPGANAGLLVDIGKTGLASPIVGSVVLTDGQFQYLITGRVYANVLTRRYKDGELRGQLIRQESTGRDSPRSP